MRPTLTQLERDHTCTMALARACLAVGNPDAAYSYMVLASRIRQAMQEYVDDTVTELEESLT